MKRSGDKRFPDYRIQAAHVVGLCVESVLKLELGTEALPKPVKAQTAQDHVYVEVLHAKEQSGLRWTSLYVKVYPKDALKAISIAERILYRLKGMPWGLQALRADMKNSLLSDSSPHDLICKATQGTWSTSGKLFSIEIKCREVITKTPSTHNWRFELESAAAVLWRQEMANEATAGAWAGRVLVFVQMPKPCHSGDFELHSSVLWRQGKWSSVFGWSGFPSLDSAARHDPPVVASASSAPRVAQASKAPWAPSPEDLANAWQGILPRMVRQGGWIKVASFLQVLGEPDGHPQRFLEGASRKKLWLLGPRFQRAPRLGTDYTRTAGKRGGGAGSEHGPLWGSQDFLQQVASVYFRHKLCPRPR